MPPSPEVVRIVPEKNLRGEWTATVFCPQGGGVLEGGGGNERKMSWGRGVDTALG